MDEISTFSTFSQVIDLWPSRAEFARDQGVSLDRVQKWAQRGGIRAEFFQRIVVTGRLRGFAITSDDLCRIAAKQAGRFYEKDLAA